jgi:hypothetical protein
MTSLGSLAAPLQPPVWRPQKLSDGVIVARCLASVLKRSRRCVRVGNGLLSGQPEELRARCFCAARTSAARSGSRSRGDRTIAAMARGDKMARRLMTIPGFGP